MTAEQINTKIDLCEAAILIVQKKGSFTIGDLSEATKKSASEIYELFPNKKAILAFYYPSIIIRYEAMIAEIEDFESFTISEKLSNYIYTSFEMMGENREFVEDTFQSQVFEKGSKSYFSKELSALFKKFFTTDAEIATSAAFLLKDYFYEFLVKEYTFLVKFWLNDSSPNRERTLALADKLTGFVEELVYNKIVDKGFDLLKYLISHAGLANKIPLFGSCITDFFKGKENE